MRLPFFNRRRRTNPNIEVVSGTDVGLKRANNEDSYFCVSGDQTPGGLDALLIVADGMGGHAAGEVASKMAVESIQSQLINRSPDETFPIGGYAAILGQTIAEANTEIYNTGVSGGKGMMGTTCTAAVKSGNELHIAHAGDSRAYLLRKEKLSQVTTDDSWVMEQVKAGNLTNEQARVHPNRNIVTQALGVGPDIDVEQAVVEVEDGDIFLLCSDGLHGLVPDVEIATVLTDEKLGEAKDILINRAKELGGDDNITVVLGRIFN